LIAFGSGLGPEVGCRKFGWWARGGMGGIGGVVLAVGVLEDKDIEWVEHDYEIEYLEIILPVRVLV
jgi:hypothetical protein